MHILNYFVTVFLWIAAIIIYFFADKKNRINLWLSAAVFVPTLRVAALFIMVNLPPYAGTSHHQNTILPHFLKLTMNFLDLESTLLYPYFLLLFSINYSEIFEIKHVSMKRFLSIGFFIPIVIITAISPLNYLTSFFSQPRYIDLIIFWALCCFILANYLIIYTCIDSKTMIEKRQRFLVCVLVTPVSIATSCTAYISHHTALSKWNISQTNMWRVNIAIISLTLVMFIVLAVRYGVLGLRLRVELNHLDDRIKTSFSGASLLNHSIKNEIANINLCNQMIRKAMELSADQKLISQLDSKLKIIENSVDRMLKISGRIHEQTKEISMDAAVCKITELIDNAIESVTASLQSKNIKVIKQIDYEFLLLCDRPHMHEVLSNILRNSIDAINENGEINIKVLKFNKYISLAITDNGSGISKNELNYVLEPFYSTKNDTLSFGLGLSYCYNVMRKHGGTLEINSEEGVGTSVILNFSPKRIVQAADKYLLKEHL